MYLKKIFKKTHFLILLMAIIMPWQMKAQETVTVCDGTAPGTTTITNSYIPIYGSFVDTQGTTSEFIIPADTEGMDALIGGVISHLTFYITNSPATWGSPVIQIYMGEVEGTTLSSLYGPTNNNVTIVAEKTLSNSQAEMEIELDTPYTYEGGNLLVGTYVKTKSDTYKATSFSGISAPSGSSWNKYSSYGSGSAQAFLPKTTFTYTPAAGGCSKPALETPSNITSHSATISWTGGSGTFNLEYKKASEEEWTSKVTDYSGVSVELDNLEANTIYNVRVQSICDGNVLSGWATKNFETPCESVTTFPFHENFNDLTTSGEIPGCWNNNDGTTTNDTYKWCYNSSCGGGYEGKCVSFDSYSNSNGNTNFLKTPVMDLPAGKVMQLRFMYKNPAGGDFSVYISTDGGVTYTTPLATGLTGQADWDEKEILLSDYTGHQNVVVVFKGTSNCGYNQANNRLYLDDVYIEEAPTCPKQSALHLTAVTSSSVTLDWTAGTNDQDHWDVFFTTDANVTPDANTTPTVANTDQKPYTHSGLNPETVYFAFVRARCSDTDQSPWTPACRFVTPQIPVTIDGDHPYDNDFETENGWLFVNGDRPNQWWYGSAANNTENGEKAIYISSDNGATNTYTNTKGVVYATKAFAFAEGVYTFTYDWRAKGNQYYDYIRVALAPASYEIVATENLPTGLSDTQLPTGWIALDGGSKLNNNDTWSTQTAHEIPVSAGEYKMVFVWRNFTYGVADNQPPAAIDNVNISYISCPRPTNFASSEVLARTATLSWTENGTATNWVLQYATDADFTTNLVKINDGFVVNSNNVSYSLTGLSGDTHYYARVKSDCESNWSDVEDFTTGPTCAKPTNWKYTSSSNTAYSGSVEWEGDANGYEIAYKPGNSGFDPSDMSLEGVIRVELGSVNSYTLENLTPDTKYYVYIRAICGGDDGMSAWSTNTVAFTTLATCVAPSSLTDVSVGSTSVNLSWTKGADDQDAWQFRYKKTSDSDYTYVLVENHLESTYELTGLDPATDYKVNVRAWCGGDDYSKWSFANQNYDKPITTACGALTIPYTCDFEGAVETSPSSSYPMPKCWYRKEYKGGYSGSYTYYPSVQSASYSSPYAHGGNGTSATSGKSLYFYKPNTSTDEAAVLPEIDGQYAMTDLQISFWARLAAYNTNKDLSIGVMTDPSDISTYTEVATITVKDDTFREYKTFFESYAGEGLYIAIRYNSSTSGYIYVDDVTVDMAPSCRMPKNLEATVDSHDQATLTWTAGKDETAWNVQLKQASANNWDEMFETNAATYTINGLKRATEYNARVRAICSTDDQSDWIETSFTTDCGVWPIDINNALFEDFDYDPFPPACWTLQPSYNGWGVNFNNAMVNDQPEPHGAAYSGTMSSGLVFLILPPMHIDGNAVLSFDQLFDNLGSATESSIAVTTLTGTFDLYTPTIWTADPDNLPSTRTNVTVSLADYNGQDVRIAFKYDGNTTSSRTWYIDNVKVYNTDSSISSTVSVGYGTGNGNWSLISSPLAGNINADDVVNMTNCDFDLYRFNQDSDEEWENWKTSGSGHYHFNLEPGRGYLYANRENQKITFVGTPYNGNGEVTLNKTEGARLSGWNLIGNPYVHQATVDKEFYRMNADGTGFIAATDNIVGLMEGIMVYAASDGEIATFSENSSKRASTEQIIINLSHKEGDIIDRVIVRFGDGGKLPKYSFGNSDAKVYIPQYDADYAVVRSNGLRDVPVSFNTNKTGNYTFSVNVENVNTSYLHLIDKITGDDIDLLDENSYTFIGSPRDAEDRFIVRFSPSTGSETEAFAYQNGSDIIVNGVGELQVYDMMGRKVMTTMVNGVKTINGLAQGVYIFRVIGETQRTQKIVVR